MPSTYSLISSNILSSSAASVTFSAIPSTYTDLVLRVSARGSFANISNIINFRVNASATSDYSRTLLLGDGSAAASARSSNVAQFQGLVTPAASSTSNVFSSAELYLPNYAGSANKVMSSISAAENNNANADLYATAGLRSNTAAVTEINLALNFGDFVAGSSFYLYGIKSS